MARVNDDRRARKASLPRPGRREADIAAMLRVDHAGEHGAVRIYEGQLAVLGASPATRASAALVAKMAAQEEEHLATFDRLLNERGVRPTAFAPLWHVAGYALGATTALMGEKAAMACTAAVEEVIDEHYAGQAKILAGKDEEIGRIVAKFRAEECEHRDTAIAHGAREAPAYPLLSGLIKAGCRVAIRLSERI